MGGAFSRTLANPTSSETKQLLDTILREMFKRADLIDLYSLADPNRCKRYVVVAESALKQLFVSIQLEPQLGPDGTFYFQKIEGIQKANPLGAKQDTYCKYLAFYFIRIFQIYAALALSILDSELPKTDILDIFRPGRPGQQRPLYAIESPLQGFPKKSTGWLGVGGASILVGSSDAFRLTEAAGLYNILNNYLIKPDGASRYPDRIDLHITTYTNMTIEQGELYTITPIGPENYTRETKRDLDKNPPTISYEFEPEGVEKGKIKLSAQIALSRVGDTLTVSLKNMKDSKGKDIPGTFEEKLYHQPSSSPKPKAEDSKELPVVLDRLFKAAYTKGNKDSYSVIDLLNRHKYLDRLDGKARIEGTDVTIMNPREYARRARNNPSALIEVPVEYSGRAKIDEKTEDIKIYTTIFVVKEPVRVDAPHTYTFTINLQEITTKPSDLLERMNLQNEKKYTVFSTGSDDRDKPLNKKGETIPVYLQRVFKGLLENIGTDRSMGGIEYKKGIPQPYNSKDVPEYFKVKDLWNALAKDPPVKAHCVARAVQLLNVSAIRGDIGDQAYSEVCRMSFPYIKNDSLPDPGKSIMTEPGILAMATLFVDKVVGEMPKISSAPKFAEFRKNMKTFFERYEKVVDNAPAKMGEIKEKLMPFCKGHTDDQILLKGRIVEALRAKAKILINRQARHVQNVMTILFKMFTRTELQKGVLKFEAGFVSGGMKSINAISEEARDLLIDYYGDCESTYKDGLYLLRTQKFTDTNFRKVGSSNVVAAPAAPAPATSTTTTTTRRPDGRNNNNE